MCNKTRLVSWFVVFLIFSAGMYVVFRPAKEVHPKKYDYHDFFIKKSDDAGKIGNMHSRLIHVPFYQSPKTGGESKDAWRIFFDSNVEIRGALVSIDHDGMLLKLMELDMYINNPIPYVPNAKADALIHTSYVRGNGGRKTDEHMFFPKGSFLLKAGDYINIGMYLTNRSNFRAEIHPEVIIYYEWKD